MEQADIGENTSFDRRNTTRARIPASTKKKILASYRTAYTTLICIIVTHFYKFGGTATYVAPLLSAISGGSAYFGQWQADAWKVTYASVFGSALGVTIGLSYEYNYIQIILLFIALIWSNRISLWDRLGKVIAAIGIVLGKSDSDYSLTFFSNRFNFGAIFDIRIHPLFTSALLLCFAQSRESLSILHYLLLGD